MSEDGTSDFDTTTSSSATDRSDDEIVWGTSDEFSSESSLSDFVLLPRTMGTAPIQLSDFGESASESDTGLSLTLDSLSITASSLSKTDEEPHDTEVTPALRQSNRGKRRGVGKPQDTNPPSGSQSPRFDTGAVMAPTSSYENAAAFITECVHVSSQNAFIFIISRYLDSPVKGRRTRGGLRLLQAFVIELGVSKELPTTVTSAKKLLKAEAHINIKDYVAVRGGDQDALRQIMHPSIKALRTSIRKTGKRQPVKWVKEQGLDVFLIGCYN